MNECSYFNPTGRAIHQSRVNASSVTRDPNEDLLFWVRVGSECCAYKTWLDGHLAGILSVVRQSRRSGESLPSFHYPLLIGGVNWWKETGGHIAVTQEINPFLEAAIGASAKRFMSTASGAHGRSQTNNRPVGLSAVYIF
jgi:hypothetical protein